MDGWTESGSVATMFYKYVFHRVLNAPVAGNYTVICFSLGYQTFIYLFTVKRSLNAWFVVLDQLVLCQKAGCDPRNEASSEP